MGAGASFGLVDTAGGGSGVALFDPETGPSSAGASFVSTGAVTSADALAESRGANSAGVLFASAVWLDMGAGPSSGALLASTDVGAVGCPFDSDAGATSSAALFNSTVSRGSSEGRGRGNGGDDTVRWW
jgi:hypothetical protein